MSRQSLCNPGDKINGGSRIQNLITSFFHDFPFSPRLHWTVLVLCLQVALTSLFPPKTPAEPVTNKQRLKINQKCSKINRKSRVLRGKIGAKLTAGENP